MDESDKKWLRPLILAVLIIGVGIGGLSAQYLGVC